MKEFFTDQTNQENNLTSEKIRAYKRRQRDGWDMSNQIPRRYIWERVYIYLSNGRYHESRETLWNSNLKIDHEWREKRKGEMIHFYSYVWVFISKTKFTSNSIQLCANNHHYCHLSLTPTFTWRLPNLCMSRMSCYNNNSIWTRTYDHD